MGCDDKTRGLIEHDKEMARIKNNLTQGDTRKFLEALSDEWEYQSHVVDDQITSRILIAKMLRDQPDYRDWRTPLTEQQIFDGANTILGRFGIGADHENYGSYFVSVVGELQQSEQFLQEAGLALASIAVPLATQQ